jgi:hypothetical protein
MGSASIRDDSPDVQARPSRGRPDRGALPDFETLDLALEHDLRAAERLVAQAGTSGPRGPDARQHCQHEAHGSLAGWHVPSISRGAGESHPEPTANAANTTDDVSGFHVSGIVQWIAWAIVAVGVAAFVCGGTLWVWSFAGDRPDLARFGLPLVLGGQAGLIIGLMLQLESLWQSTQQTTQSLDVLDDQVAEIKHATTLLGTTHSAASASFYSHYAQGASPHMLLADLKGQLDLLAMKMSRK